MFGVFIESAKSWYEWILFERVGNWFFEIMHNDERIKDISHACNVCMGPGKKKDKGNLYYVWNANP